MTEQNKMIIKVIALGTDVKEFPGGENLGYTNRAFSKSGKTLGEKAWGKGFLSFSPRLQLDSSPLICGFNPDRELYFEKEEVKPDSFTCNIPCDTCRNLKPDLLYDYNIFEGTWRSDRQGNEYIALFRPADEYEEITHYIIRFVTNYKNFETVTETTGRVISTAISESEDGQYRNCEQLLLLKTGDTVVTENREYIFAGERLRWKNKDFKVVKKEG